MINYSLEDIVRPQHKSFHYQLFDLNTPNRNSPHWHYHPEVELIFISKGKGKRGVGTSLSTYTDGDLILLGSNLQHMGFTDSFEDGKTEVVIQFLPNFLGNMLTQVPELNSIFKLLELSKRGLSFSGPIKEKVGQALIGLQYESDFQSLLTLINILKEMSLVNPNILNTTDLTTSDTDKNDRLKKVFNYIKSNYQDEINLSQIADQTNMTTSSFCRYFKLNTGKSFIQYVNEYKINHAAKLLLETNLNVKTICFDSGFNNFSNFNRFFKKHYQTTPKKYREKIIN
jgi:AraC-like DNA-binding protein/quercetin dioxygenase-like cupin family protein